MWGAKEEGGEKQSENPTRLSESSTFPDDRLKIGTFACAAYDEKER